MFEMRIITVIIGAAALFCLCSRSSTQAAEFFHIENDILNRMNSLRNDVLDVSIVVAMETDPVFQREAAEILLDRIIRYGNHILVRHIVKILGSSPPPSLEAAVRQRMTLNTIAQLDREFLIDAWTFLANRNDEKAIGELLNILASENKEECQLAARYFRQTDIKHWPDAKWLQAYHTIRKALEDNADDPTTVACLLAAKANIESTDRDRPIAKLKRLTSKCSGAAARRTLLEYSLARNREPFIPPQFSDLMTKDYLELGQMDPWSRKTFTELVSEGTYVERLLSIENLAICRDATSTKLLLDYGMSPEWDRRMGCAYFLMMTGDKIEAASMIFKERNPVVQTTLLCVFTRP